ncbi:hypothetical protein SS50377_27060 [Spironucleus salmonicida]|uniref:Uncharacterized protein n=1 Tax=Spironucleus salmonicida TaxID=348837 RepID=V6M3Z7_9EUKA|nr:hypothetical protein SS50377_27060 [Spironucleus salmonicida]|eukprot:EST48044.1 Hypothetical protein SS50377_11810 [Spironucleus salmonicida]
MQDRASLRKTNQNSEIDTGNRSSDYHKIDSQQQSHEVQFNVPSKNRSDDTFNFNNAPTDYGRKNTQFQQENCNSQEQHLQQQDQDAQETANANKHQQSSSNASNFFGNQQPNQCNQDRICLKTQKKQNDENEVQQPERVSFMKKKTEQETALPERVSFAKKRSD